MQIKSKLKYYLSSAGLAMDIKPEVSEQQGLSHEQEKEVDMKGNLTAISFSN